MKVYIAGPMSGLPDYNYPAFNRAADALALAGHEPLNPTDSEMENPTPGTPQPWDWYMRHALRMVLEADAIALLDGWNASRGANLEARVGLDLGIPVRPIGDYLVLPGVIVPSFDLEGLTA